ncbi:hypothetical protein ACQJ22_25020 [Pseudomonas fragariae (ex Marin et al. 2024)]|uniref:hypothetical protein n=1 Tax=Pseudomonas TaxID=286 RepID=UPI0004527EDD|nr:hypothetical protein [Pseudomonas syringae]AKF43775.1 hypothetical protein PsyrB_01120 [Pseudomonas syringae pv. syringae B301D]EXL29597.1 hypothetical protein PssB301D_04184 [Pseudomonas syringae pv. syringae str. B301D-R]
MLQRHKNLLANKLDQLWYEGVVKIERWEMVSIFQKERVTVKDWRAVSEAWTEMYESPEKADDLNYIEVRNGEQPLPAAYLIYIKRYGKALPA